MTFLYFDVRTVIGEIADATGLADFLSDQLLGFVIRFATDSLVNMVKAFIWPVYIVQIYPPFGPIALGLAFYIFPVYLKKPIETWLFHSNSVRLRTTVPVADLIDIYGETACVHITALIDETASWRPALTISAFFHYR